MSGLHYLLEIFFYVVLDLVHIQLFLDLHEYLENLLEGVVIQVQLFVLNLDPYQ